jgi:hypothetical protein
VSLIVAVTWKRKEEWRTVEPVLLAKLRKLFRRRLLAKNGDSRITGDEFDQECNERDDGPNNQQQNKQAFQDAHFRA